jgi:hypothetical protein
MKYHLGFHLHDGDTGYVKGGAGGERSGWRVRLGVSLLKRLQRYLTL